MIDLKFSTIDESSTSGNESLIEDYNFMQNRGNQLAPAMKPDGTIVIPGIVRIISGCSIKMDQHLITIFGFLKEQLD